MAIEQHQEGVKLPHRPGLERCVKEHSALQSRMGVCGQALQTQHIARDTILQHQGGMKVAYGAGQLCMGCVNRHCRGDILTEVSSCGSCFSVW